MKKYILGISAFYHDSAAVLIQGSEIVAAAHEERFTRIKHDASFPREAIRYVLEEALANIDDIEAIVFYDKPLNKFERLLETYHAYAPQGLKSFLTSMPSWIKEKTVTRKLIRNGLEEIFGSIPRNLKIFFSEHHLSHAASAFFPSPFDDAAILTVDGVGEWATTSIFEGHGNKIKVRVEQRFPHSLGLLYSAFTYYCGFKVNSGEYKLMGLAPYGNPNDPEVTRYRELILKYLMDLKDDGSLYFNMDYFNFAVGLTMVNEKKWEDLFGLPIRKAEAPLDQSYMNMALAIQQVTTDVVLRLAREAKRLTGCSNLVLAGGVALNCVANGRLLLENIFEKVWIQPAAGDAGGALGAALAYWHIGLDQPRIVGAGLDGMKGSYLGPSYSNEFIQKILHKNSIPYKFYSEVDALTHDVADLLANEKVVGWFQGRMEWGPRALGNRSILGDPRSKDMQKKLNLKIKYREGFRPFAPSVLFEDVQTYFNLKESSPYMLLVADVLNTIRNEEPPGYSNFPMYDRLYHTRSQLPSITHIDYSARIQTVHRETNERYWKLIKAFRAITGVGVVVNTSFNVRGEPIVCTPLDAIRCFMNTEMDYLVLGNFVLSKFDVTDDLKGKFKQQEFALD